MSNYPETIGNPVRKGDVVRLPSGTVVRTTHPRRGPKYQLRRAQSVTVFSAFSGYIDIINHQGRGSGYFILPTITWVGTGGYWCEAQMVKEVLDLNHLSAPELPITIPPYKLDHIPGYFGPNTDQWKKD